MSTYDPTYYCEFTVGIKLNVPIIINPQVSITPTNSVEQKLPIHLEPDFYLKPEVSATPALCLPQNGYNKAQLPAQERQQLPAQERQQYE